MTRVMTVAGTRPEIIRLSRVIARLDRTVDHVLVHTGQNWDPALRDVFFDELELPKPDRDLAVDTGSLGAVLAGVLVGVEKAITEVRPDALLVLGDTNSSIAALIARRMKVPVYHMEAGNRCFDQNVPEETNRRLVDHVSDFNLVYTEHARRNLLAEGLHPRRITHTGSPLREVLDHYRPGIAASRVLARLGLRPGGYFLVSAHREENVDTRLDALLDCLRAVRARWRLPVVMSTHPRTRARLARSGVDTLDGVTFHPPFGFFDYVHLQAHARCTLSDSGTISEEAAILGFPAVCLREAIERPEALETGVTLLAGLRPEAVHEAIHLATTRRASCPADYEITDTSARVVAFLLSTVRQHHAWAGLRS
ncbi:non-hydrolyzing UDP-N-acetylglucosamine 2-epimerase [Actinoplanes siamensis]|uniref:UDP-N-acetyl glucosamine 2-epimerase n=1 Tax=Actinoplanes siamensis TaxID=1223317 RepID=A0A919N3N7_9ACTN|nr:UDP-N-acetylglucosamine 2-epimerase (non-hydrolyzing) [Actinoplanes siamensis]GIF03799.1 UDP-N-acetyl glucosamine 2-epimerase [Actinoplanes siamensis]